MKKKNGKKSKSSAAKSESNDRDDCSHCRDGHEYYRMIFDRYKFDVDRARQIVDDDREIFELDEEDLDHTLEWARIHRPHLAHVDISYPGIIAHYWYPEKDGTLLHGHVLIDGHHRAAKCKELGVTFRVKVLDENESREVTMRAPEIPNSIAMVSGPGTVQPDSGPCDVRQP